VLNELEWDTRVEWTDIGIEVDNSIVTLTGTVSSWARKLERSRPLVASTSPTISSSSYRAVRSGTEIPAAIRHALIWDARVPEERIQTTVSNGIVELRGEVELASQRDDT
jgi:osmotically-inducible protein OsmY